MRWDKSEVKWASRWDTYLAMRDVQIHWFSIVNSIVVVLCLTGFLSIIIIRTVRRDIANYNKEEDLVRNKASPDGLRILKPRARAEIIIMLG